MSDYIDKGDRVVVVHDRAFGEHGVVVENNGWGRCSVRLDNGRVVTAWNVAELIREGDPVPSEPAKTVGYC